MRRLVRPGGAPTPLRIALVTAAALGVGAALVGPSCLSPTEVTLEISTDVPCTADGGVPGDAAPKFDRGVQIRVGSAAALEGDAAPDPVTVTPACTPSGGENSVGSFVVTPSGDKGARFAVEVVMGVTRAPEDCAAPTDGSLPYSGCIVARRQLAFVEHTPITLPIDLLGICVGVFCDNGSTCGDDGQCHTSVCPDILNCNVNEAGVNEAAANEVGPPPGDSGLFDAVLGDSGQDVSPGMDGAQSDASPVPDGAPEVGCVACADSGCDQRTTFPCPNSPPCSSTLNEECCGTVSDAGVVNASCKSIATATCPPADAGFRGFKYTCTTDEDCTPGNICCVQYVAGSFTASCQGTANCPGGIELCTPFGTCRQCPGGMPCNGNTCFGVTFGSCSAAFQCP